MNQIIEKISWIPYKFLIKIKKRKNPLNLDFNKIGINKKFKFHISLEDEGLSSQLNTFGFREPINVKYFYNFIKKEDKVMDIGANLGLFTILSENAKKIVCVEPLKQAIPILKKNIEENGLKNKINIVNAAVGNNKKLLIEVNPALNLSGATLMTTSKTQEVKCFTLKALANKYDTNTIKIDVEGYEYEILYKKIPKIINRIAIEFHTALLGKEKVKKLLNYFEDENFKVKYLIEDLPIRLYPFHNFIKKIGLLKKITYVKKNLRPKECLQYINKGRKVKYLFLER